MDINYILLNTLVYWTVWLVVWSVFAYQKYLNFSIWVLFIASTYLTYFIHNNWINLYSIIFTILLFWSILLSNNLIVTKFSNIKERDLFWLIFTIWITIFSLNILRLIFWSEVISIDVVTINNNILLIILLSLLVIIYYILNYSYIWKIFKSIHANPGITKSLWVNINVFFNYYLIFLITLMILISYLNILSSNIKISDDVFFLLKWIWIMILVWISKLEYIYLWALLYVITEYVLFIILWFPISLKESLILIIILIVLFIKPNWLFTLKSRNI